MIKTSLSVYILNLLKDQTLGSKQIYENLKPTFKNLTSNNVRVMLHYLKKKGLIRVKKKNSSFLFESSESRFKTFLNKVKKLNSREKGLIYFTLWECLPVIFIESIKQLIIHEAIISESF